MKDVFTILILILLKLKAEKTYVIKYNNYDYCNFFNR